MPSTISGSRAAALSAALLASAALVAAPSVALACGGGVTSEGATIAVDQDVPSRMYP